MLASAKQQLVNRCSEYLKTDVEETFNLHECDIASMVAELAAKSEWYYVFVDMPGMGIVNYLFDSLWNGEGQQLINIIVKNVSEFLIQKESEYASKYNAEKLEEARLAVFASCALDIDRAISMTQAKPCIPLKLIKLGYPLTIKVGLRARVTHVEYISTWQLLQTSIDGMHTVWKFHGSSDIPVFQGDACYAIKRISRDGPLHNLNKPHWRFCRKRKSDQKWLPLTLNDLRFRSIRGILGAGPMNKHYQEFATFGKSLPIIKALLNSVFNDAARLILRSYVLMYISRKSLP